jgi:hypothetical protein
MAPLSRRLWATLLIPALVLAGQQLLLLPGLDHAQLTQVLRMAAHRSNDRSTFSVLGLGLAPALSAFVIVEWMALLVPSWRRLRRGSPAQRGSLRRAATILTFALALVQAWFLARYFTTGLPQVLRLFEDSTATRLVITVSLVGGTGLVLVLAALIDRFGLGNGFSVLLVAPIVPAALQLSDFVRTQQPRELLWLAVELLALVFVTRWILGAHRRASGPRPPLVIRQPTSGLAPIAGSASLLALYARLPSAFATEQGTYAPEPGTMLYLIVFVALTIAGAVILSRLYHPTAKLGELWRRVAPAESPETLQAELAPALKLAIGRTLAFLLAVGALLPFLMRAPRSSPSFDLLLVVTATAVAMDLLAEWRARQVHSELVAVWPLHQVAFLDVAIAALAEAGIPVHARAANNRALLWFFGPYVPIDLMVPPEHVLAARERLAALLLDPAPESRS